MGLGRHGSIPAFPHRYMDPPVSTPGSSFLETRACSPFLFSQKSPSLGYIAFLDLHYFFLQSAVHWARTAKSVPFCYICSLCRLLLLRDTKKKERAWKVGSETAAVKRLPGCKQIQYIWVSYTSYLDWPLCCPKLVFFSRSLHHIFSDDDDDEDDDDGDELTHNNAFSYATPEALLDDSRFLWRMAHYYYSFSVRLSLPSGS